MEGGIRPWRPVVHAVFLVVLLLVEIKPSASRSPFGTESTKVSRPSARIGDGITRWLSEVQISGEFSQCLASGFFFTVIVHMGATVRGIS